jgi:hypothetical protein
MILRYFYELRLLASHMVGSVGRLVWSSRCASCSFAYDDVQVHFKVKTHTKFQKIMEAYASKRSVDVAAIRFLYDGQRLDKNSTPGLYPRL